MHLERIDELHRDSSNVHRLQRRGSRASRRSTISERHAPEVANHALAVIAWRARCALFRAYHAELEKLDLPWQIATTSWRARGRREARATGASPWPRATASRWGIEQVLKRMDEPPLLVHGPPENWCYPFGISVVAAAPRRSSCRRRTRDGVSAWGGPEFARRSRRCRISAGLATPSTSRTSCLRATTPSVCCWSCGSSSARGRGDAGPRADGATSRSSTARPRSAAAHDSNPESRGREEAELSRLGVVSTAPTSRAAGGELHATVLAPSPTSAARPPRATRTLFRRLAASPASLALRKIVEFAPGGRRSRKSLSAPTNGAASAAQAASLMEELRERTAELLLPVEIHQWSAPGSYQVISRR